MATSKKRTTKSGKKKKQASPVPATATPESPQAGEGAEEELKRDLLDDFLFNAANYIYVRRKMFISLAVIVAVIILSVYGTVRFLQYRDNLRNEALYGIERIIHDPSLTAKEQYQKALPMLNRFLENHAGTEQSPLALMYRGGLYYQQNEYKASEADFRSVRSSQPKDSERYILASIYLSNVLRDQGRIAEAVDVLKTAQTEKMTDMILMELAELYHQSGQKDEAEKTLGILVQDFPNSPYHARAKQMLELL